MPASEKILVDTGPLVAFLARAENHHSWALKIFAELPTPLLTCQAVLSEAQFLIERAKGNPRSVLDFVQLGALEVDFDVQANVDRLLELQESYRSLPMSLADACLVCMSEQFPRSRVITTDSHFRIYRRRGRQIIPLLMPEKV